MIRRFVNIFRGSEKVLNELAFEANQGWLPVLDSEVLLNDLRRKNYLKEIWDLTSFTDKSFQTVIKDPILRFAGLVQQVPASETHHHAYLGGLLDHSLECMIFALKIRRKHMLPPGSTAEEQSAKSDLWTAGIALAALSHDISKPLLDLEIELKNGDHWSLIDGPIPKSAGYYRFKYKKNRTYRTHGVSSSLLFGHLVSGELFKWFQTDAGLIDILLMSLSGHVEHGGIVSTIVLQADMASVGQNMGGNPNAIPFEAPKDTLQSKLRAGLKEIVREKFKLNDQGAHGFYDHDTNSLFLVSMRAANELRAHLLGLGIESVPSANPPLFDELQSHNLIIANESGKAIWKCLVSIGNWEAQLTMLKVNPALIWDEVPQLKAVKVTILSDTKVVPEPQNNEEETPVPNAVPLSAGSVSNKPDPSSDPVGDLLSLFAAPEEPLTSSPKVASTDNVIVSEAVSKQAPTIKTVSKLPAAKVVSKSTATKKSAVKKDGDVNPDFFEWLKDGIIQRKLIINDTNAAVHIVRGRYLLVSPKIFKRYASEIYGTDADFVQIQNEFQKLGIHERTSKATNIFNVAVEGTRRTSMIKGYLLKDCDLPPPLPDNPFLKMLSEIA